MASKNQNINIVELLDEHIRLYAPVMMQLLEEFPEVDNAYNFIGRDEPTALPQDDEHRGYHLDGFQERATELMKPLVSATFEVQKRCKATKSIREPVSVHICKLNDSLINIKAHATNRMGGLYVDRNAYVAPRHKDCIITKPAILRITTLTADNEVDPLKAACEIGLSEAVSVIKNTECLFNGEWIDKKQFDMWIADFPVDEASKPSPKLWFETLVIDVKSAYRPTVIFTSDEHFGRMKEMLGEEYVEKLEPILTSELGFKF
ncbi:hypothetical protein [Mesorhizobium sp. SP-1A]|uniref:hypothetical protein n=1 Tax=Mesorhizobium sp. SP-1A TaxID=3077840 RepID=UPI0028F74988|nr:hypothetical protein [Mesorhizobium sp. SP-1A]